MSLVRSEHVAVPFLLNNYLITLIDSYGGNLS